MSGLTDRVPAQFHLERRLCRIWEPDARSVLTARDHWCPRVATSTAYPDVRNLLCPSAKTGAALCRSAQGGDECLLTCVFGGVQLQPSIFSPSHKVFNMLEACVTECKPTDKVTFCRFLEMVDRT